MRAQASLGLVLGRRRAGSNGRLGQIALVGGVGSDNGSDNGSDPAAGDTAGDSASHAPGSDTGSARTPAPATTALQVLYIDDNPVNTLLMAAMFERMPGLELQCECEPHAGVALALAKPPALLLIDIQMPGIDGFEVLRQLRADPATKDVPAIAVSANAMPQDLERGWAAGFADYLTKPLELQRLHSALQAVLPGWSAGPA